MKYSRLFLCVVILSLISLVGCGGIDPVSQMITDDIASLGEVSVEDENKVEKILERYGTLTEEQKKQVKNYTTLLKAQDKIEELKIAEDNVEEANVSEAILFERDYYEQIYSEVKNISYSLKDPDSLKVREIYVMTNGVTMSKVAQVVIYCTASNSYGGNVSEFMKSDYSGVHETTANDLVILTAKGTYTSKDDNCSVVKRYDGVWDWIEGDKTFVHFSVDIDDMRNQGYDIP